MSEEKNYIEKRVETLEKRVVALEKMIPEIAEKLGLMQKALDDNIAEEEDDD